MKKSILQKKALFESSQIKEIVNKNKLPIKVITNFNGKLFEFEYLESLRDYVSKLNPLFIRKFNSEQTKVKLIGSGSSIKISFLI